MKPPTDSNFINEHTYKIHKKKHGIGYTDRVEYLTVDVLFMYVQQNIPYIIYTKRGKKNVINTTLTNSFLKDTFERVKMAHKPLE